MTQKLAFGADGADFAVETVLVSVEEGPVTVTMLRNDENEEAASLTC